MPVPAAQVPPRVGLIIWQSLTVLKDEDEPDEFVVDVVLFVSFVLSGINPIIYNKSGIKNLYSNCI